MRSVPTVHAQPGKRVGPRGAPGRIPGRSSTTAQPTSNTAHVLTITSDLSSGNCIQVTVGQLKTLCLVDTGAQISCISEKFLNQITRSEVRRLEPTDLPQIRLADGKVVPLAKKVQLQFGLQQKVGRKKKEKQFLAKLYVVPELTCDILLGIDFLQAHQAVIDFSQRTMALKPIAVNADCELLVPARSETVHLVAVNTQLPSECTGVVTGTSVVAKRNLIAAKVLTTPKGGKVAMRFANPTNQNVSIPKGSRVGNFELLPPNTSIIEWSPPSTQAATMSHYTTPPVQAINITKRPQRKVADDLNELDRLLDLTDSTLTPEQQKELTELIHRYRDVFALSDKELGCATAIKHKINLMPGATPIAQRAYRTNPHQKRIIEQQIQDMLDADVVEESRAAWAAPIVLVPKPNGQDPRFCVDYRALNQKTLGEAYPMPLVQESLDALGQTQPQYFSTLDLRSGYWQIAMEDDSKDFTSFISSSGLYRFKKMPFGLKTAPQTFQRFMADLLRKEAWNSVLIYLDDLILFSHTFAEHLQHIEQVFLRLRQAGLKLKPQKCHFAKAQVPYLGHLVNKDGVRPDPDRCKAVQKAKTPHNLRTLRGFLGLCNYYRRFIEGHSKIASPLHNLLKKDVKFVWSPECEQAFQTLKAKLVAPPLLGFPDFNKDFRVYTDASDYAVGSVLCQNQDGVERIIAYSGRAMNRHEVRMGITEKEALGVIAAVKAFDPYLRNNKFTIVSDHKALLWLMSAKGKEPVGRVGRWVLFLQQYDYNIEHKAGSKHQNADGLSRQEYDPHPDDAVMDDMPEVFAITTRSGKVVGVPNTTVTTTPNPNKKHDRTATQTNPKDKSPAQPTKDSKMATSRTDPRAPSTITGHPSAVQPSVDTNNSQVTPPTGTPPTDRNQAQVQSGVNTDPQSADGDNKDHTDNDSTTDPQSLDQILDPGTLKDLQQKDPYCKPLLDYKLQGTLPQDDKDARKVLLEAEDYILQDGILHHLWYAPGKGPKQDRVIKQVVIPLQLRDTLLKALHDSITAGHGGIARTYTVLRQRYFWRKMAEDCENYVKSCRKCSQRKGAREKHRAPLCPMPITEGPFRRWSVDCIGPLTETVNGNRYIVLLMDSFARWSVAEATPDIKAGTIAKLLFDRVITVYGAPHQLLSDRGSNFLSLIVKELCRYCGTHKINTSSYHAPTNGQNERMNRVLYDSLAMCVSQKANDWDEYLQSCLFAHRISPSAETTNASPFLLLFGLHPKLPIDTALQLPDKAPKSVKAHLEQTIQKVQMYRKLAADHLAKNKAKMKEVYDKRASKQKFRLGDSVWLYNPKLIGDGPQSPKLAWHWLGPYYINEVLGPVNFRLRQVSTNKLLSVPVHANRLKIAWARHLHRPQNADVPKAKDAQQALAIDISEVPADSLQPAVDSQATNGHTATPATPDTNPTQYANTNGTRISPTDHKDPNPSDDNEYIIRKIIKGRYKKGRAEYLIAWDKSKVRTWEPYENLNQAARDFVDKYPMKMTGRPPQNHKV